MFFKYNIKGYIFDLEEEKLFEFIDNETYAEFFLKNNKLPDSFIVADMGLIQSIVGGVDANKTFGMGEACEIQIPLDMYCKFTSTEMGAAQIFWS